MTTYIFDTDHLSLYGRNHPTIISKVEATNAQLITTVVNIEEQLRGRLAQVTDVNSDPKRGIAY